jgi:hypothetical protein
MHSSAEATVGKSTAGFRLDEARHCFATRWRSGVLYFTSDEKGAVSLEFTILVPFFVMFLVFFADATVIYLTDTEMFNAAREISRRASTGELQDLSQAEAYASDKLFLGGRTYYLDVDFAGDEKVVTLSIPIYDAAIFGFFFQPIIGRMLVVTATTSEEPRI